MMMTIVRDDVQFPVSATVTGDCNLYKVATLTHQIEKL